MLRKVYAKLLERRIKVVPKHIMVVADESLFNNFDIFLRFLSWSKKFKIEEVTVCFSENTSVDVDRLKALNFNINVIYRSKILKINGEGPTLNLILGYRGKEEIVDAVKKIANMVLSREIEPDDVDEKLVERFLVIKSPPDLIIKAGREVPEFLIWQSIYSELYFVDIEWKYFRYVDFLRCLREFQKRERRYGR